MPNWDSPGREYPTRRDEYIEELESEIGNMRYRENQLKQYNKYKKVIGRSAAAAAAGMSRDDPRWNRDYS